MHRFLKRHLDLAANEPLHAGHHWKKLLVRAAVITLVTGLVVIGGKALAADLPAIEQWIKAQGVWMPVIFCAVFFVGTLFCLPSDVFIFAAGTLFGLWWGFLYVVITEYIAMIALFFIARTFMRKRIEHFMAAHPKFNAIDKAVSHDGLRITFLLRLGPVPFSPLSYILGVSRIDFRTYLLASPGMLLSLFAVVYYGMVAQHLTKLATGEEHHSPIHYASMIGGGVVALFATVYIARVARKALKDAAAL